MQSILSRGNRAVLQQFAWSNVLLGFDYDGTLAPIVREPAKAGLRPSTRALLEQLTQRYPCVVISGRGQADALARVRGLQFREVIGNHGAEPWHANQSYLGAVAGWRSALEKDLQGVVGVQLEDKSYSLAVHYRQSREKKRAREAILEAVRRLGDVRLIGGKQVINILPTTAPHKGMALEKARDRLGCDTALYVGDDETDEDVFVLDQPGRLLTIRVGASARSSASYCISKQAEMDLLLRALLELRSGDDAQRRARG